MLRISVGNCSLPRKARKPRCCCGLLLFGNGRSRNAFNVGGVVWWGTGLLADLQVENGSPVMALQRHRRGRFNVLFFRTSKHVPIMSQNNPRRRAFSINSAYSDWGQSVREVKSMRTVLFSTAVIAGVVWMGIEPANAGPQSVSGIGNTNIQAATIESVGYRRRYYRRYYRRYGYPAPYAYYPPAYGYYVPPSAYAYPPAIGHYPPPDGNYADAPPPDGDYADAPPPDGNYADAPPPNGDYADAPPPENY